ncbi:AI-2E family transporter [Alteromonas pelagimontana]|uniref:AI-2E family transporter n=1 Tax=Alteromonas pelagimontana TaxID=1858656 RepID=A0A6M4MAV4_9ALTE|nr:AI-2E family transporter [Alteromonas pelagimontana]QJR79770.1 AI-2E family transporter [Alteromonas pelagimontana]
MELKSPTAKTLIVLACLVVVLAGIKAASDIMVPFFLSGFIAIACSPIINRATRHKIPRWISVTLVILLILVFGFLLAGLVGQSMAEFQENLPQYRQTLDSEFSWVIQKLALMNIHINRDFVISYFDPGMAMSVATNFISGMGGVLSNLFLILLTVIFMLFEADSIPARLHIALSDPEMKIQHIDKFMRSVNNYLAIKTVVSLATGLFIGVWLYFMQIDHFLLWAVLAFMLNYIPNIGSILAAVPAILIGFVQYGLASAGLVALAFLLVNTIMGNMVEPRLLGRGMGLSTLVVFLSLIFWGWLLGSVGMLLSVPLTMVVKIALESREESRWLAILLSSAGEKEHRIL